MFEFTPAVSAGFVTQELISGNVSAIAASNNRVFVAREDSSTILVYDPLTSTQLVQISLSGVAGATNLTGVLALEIVADSDLFIGTFPTGQIFEISSLTASLIGPLPDISGGTSPTHVTAIASDANRIVIGVNTSDTARAGLFRTTSGVSLAGLTALNFGLDTKVERVNDITLSGSNIFVSVSDSLAPTGLGHLLSFGTLDTATTYYTGETSVTALVTRSDTVFFAVPGAGTVGIFALSDTRVPEAVIPESTVYVMLFAPNGAQTTTYVGSSTSVLRTMSSNGNISTLGVPDTRITGIIDLVYVAHPERVYGVAKRDGGSLLFYYDIVAPTILSVEFQFDTTQTASGVSETVKSVTTWGDYLLHVTTDEKLNTAPLVTLTYPDGGQQIVTVAGTDTFFSGTFTVASTRPIGTVNVTVVAVDDAGNTGTVVTTGTSFSLQSPGRSVVANNLVRPSFSEFARVRYDLRAPEIVTIKIYNMRGQEIIDLSPGRQVAGQYQNVTWGGLNSRGAMVASGVYLLRIEAGNQIKKTHKIMLIR